MPTIAPSTPSLLAGSVDAQASMLRVAREDITFFNRSRDLVQLEVTVHNRGEAVSRPAWMRVNAAPLGAFVDSKPVARLRVPGIPTGQHHVLDGNPIPTWRAGPAAWRSPSSLRPSEGQLGRQLRCPHPRRIR